MPTIQYSARSDRLYEMGGSLDPPESSTLTASRSLQPFLQGSLGDRPRHLHAYSTLMLSNNNCSICRLLVWSPCFYHQTEQGNLRQQTSLRLRCGTSGREHFLRPLHHIGLDRYKRAKNGLCLWCKIVHYLSDKNNISPASQTFATVWISPKICQGQPPTMYSEYSRFSAEL